MVRIAGVCLLLGVLVSAECDAEKLIRPDFRSKLIAPNERGERLYSIWFDAAFIESLGPQGEAPARCWTAVEICDYRANLVVGQLWMLSPDFFESIIRTYRAVPRKRPR